MDINSAEYISAEQALEEAKGLTFEKVWASLMEDRKQMNASRQAFERRMEKTEKEISNLSKNLGGLGNSLGELTEALFSAELWEKFYDIGFPFSTQSSNKKFVQDRKVLAEVDLFLENGDYVMAVEIKSKLTTEFVNDHLERIEIVRNYMNERGDARKIIAAVAGGVIEENVIKYSHKKGLYVLVQTGDSIAIADAPEGFIAKEW